MEVAAIFDIDGTLVTFKFDVQGTRRLLIAELVSRGVDAGGLDLNTPTQGILDAARTRMGDGRSFEEYRAKAFSVLDSFELEGASSTRPFPGVRDALLSLKARGVRIAVLTNSGRKSADEALGRAGLAGFFEFVLTREDTAAMKPSPDGLRKAAEKLSMPLDKIYYVGDSPFDIMAAKGAGIRVVSVATGNYSVDRLREAGADSVITSLSQLGDVLGVQPK